jgi:hypothetical protein
MYWVVVYDAKPGSKWDLLPLSFLSHHSALAEAIDLAKKFKGAPDAPKSITILTPDDGPQEWSVGGLLFTRRFGIA